MKRRRFFQIIPLLLAALGLKSAKVKIPLSKIHRSELIGACWQDCDGMEWIVESICPQGYLFQGEPVLNYFQDKYLVTSGKESGLLSIYFDRDDVCDLSDMNFYRYA